MEKAWAVNTIMTCKPSCTQEATQWEVHIVDAKCEKTDLRLHDQKKLLEFLTEYEELLFGTLSDLKTNSISCELKEDTKPYYDRPLPVPRVHKETIIKELNKVNWECWSFSPHQNGCHPHLWCQRKIKPYILSIINNFREVNKLLVRKPFPIPKISTVLQE